MDRKQRRTNNECCAVEMQTTVTQAELLRGAWSGSRKVAILAISPCTAMSVGKRSSLSCWLCCGRGRIGRRSRRLLTTRGSWLLRCSGAVALNTYQGLTGALRSYTDQILPQLWSHMQRRWSRRPARIDGSAAGWHWRWMDHE